MWEGSCPLLYGKATGRSEPGTSISTTDTDSELNVQSNKASEALMRCYASYCLSIESVLQQCFLFISFVN